MLRLLALKCETLQYSKQRAINDTHTSAHINWPPPSPPPQSENVLFTLVLFQRQSSGALKFVRQSNACPRVVGHQKSTSLHCGGVVEIIVVIFVNKCVCICVALSLVSIMACGMLTLVLFSLSHFSSSATHPRHFVFTLQLSVSLVYRLLWHAAHEQHLSHLKNAFICTSTYLPYKEGWLFTEIPSLVAAWILHLPAWSLSVGMSECQYCAHIKQQFHTSLSFHLFSSSLCAKHPLASISISRSACLSLVVTFNQISFELLLQLSFGFVSLLLHIWGLASHLSRTPIQAYVR